MRLIPAFVIACVLFSCGNEGKYDTKNAGADKKDLAAIQQLLDKQVEAWNKGNIDEFMEGYWKSDSILFIGSSVTNGWNSTLARYKKSYPDKAAMGILNFDILRMDFIDQDSYLITGKFHLKRDHDAPEGIFTLLVQRKSGKWVVVYDHTS